MFDIAVLAGVDCASHTVNGTVRAKGVDDGLQERAVDGNLRLSIKGKPNAKTVNGSIGASFGAASLNGEASFETVNGSVTLLVAESINADVEIRTANGWISTDVPINTPGPAIGVSKAPLATAARSFV